MILVNTSARVWRVISSQGQKRLGALLYEVSYHLRALVSFRWLFQILPHLIESSLASYGLKMGHQKYPKLYESIDLWKLIPDHRYDINIRICMG